MPSKIEKNNIFFFYDDCSSICIKPNSLEHAYLAVLKDDLSAAEKIFMNIDSPRAKWGKALVSIIKGYMQEFPTYFQIRNFLEIDLEFLIKNEKIEYVEQLLGALEYLAGINQQVYKFAARVMFENNLYSVALSYMEKSKEIYYNDPELHFMFARFFLNVNNYIEAERYIHECRKLMPDYYPAKLLEAQIDGIKF